MGKKEFFKNTQNRPIKNSDCWFTCHMLHSEVKQKIGMVFQVDLDRKCE